MKRVFLLAGESSGDLHGSALMNRMKARMPDIEFTGIGGSLMEREGLEAVRHVQEMNFMGMVEVIRHIPFIRRTMKELEVLLDSRRPDLVILIDYPGFNLKFAPLVKKRGIPLMYYISPQLWAWHRSRVSIVRKYVDRMVVLFDFERDFYRRYGIKAYFVGHPLLDVVNISSDREPFFRTHSINNTVPLIGIFPGSRIQEIERILPSMVESIERTPMAIVYKTSLVTYLMGKALVDIPNIGLINIVSGSRVVPELWQNDVTPENISLLIGNLVKDDRLREKVKHALETVKSKLGTPGASDRAADIALEMM